MCRTRDEILENRRRLREQYGELLDSTAAVLFRCDPGGVNFEVNTDEYINEAETIVMGLSGCRSADDVLQVVHEELVRSFNPIGAGPKELHKEIATEIWKLWQVYRNRPEIAPGNQ